MSSILSIGYEVSSSFVKVDTLQNNRVHKIMHLFNLSIFRTESHRIFFSLNRAKGHWFPVDEVGTVARQVFIFGIVKTDTFSMFPLNVYYCSEKGGDFGLTLRGVANHFHL